MESARRPSCAESVERRPVLIPGPRGGLEGEIAIPADAHGIVIFAHGSGSSRASPRNQWVARQLESAGLGTVLFDLLTRHEEADDRMSGAFRFDIPFLAARLREATEWVAKDDRAAGLRIGYFGASTGAAAALVATADLGDAVGAVVSRGGRPDLAGEALERVTAPTLLVVGERDEVVIGLNQEAYARLRGERMLRIVPGATHLFEEPGALDEVAALAAEWFQRWLVR